MRVIVEQRATGTWYWYVGSPDGESIAVESPTDYGSPDEAAAAFDDLMNWLRSEVTVLVADSTVLRGLREVASYQSEGAHGD